jgi:hypothetical protein
MPFILADIDQKAIGQVQIKGNPSGFTLNSGNLQFPPIVTKDSKSGNWETKDSSSYEPIAYLKSSNPRNLGLKFEWVVGGQWTPDRIHKTIDDVKKYFYMVYLAKFDDNYPAVEITKLYNLITQRTTWRMNSVDVTYSPEMIAIGGTWYPLHTIMTMDLLAVTKIKGGVGGPMSTLNNLVDSPQPGWY